MIRRWLTNEDGAAAVEFAFIGPVMIVMLMGIVSYGGCFWMSHSLQQLANDSARATIGGLSSAERYSLAQATMSSEVQTYPSLSPALTTLSESENAGAQTVTVAVSYDASTSPFWAMKNLLPLPAPTLVRQATIQLGGY
jgi:Flp pilus assembly protein TadG